MKSEKSVGLWKTRVLAVLRYLFFVLYALIIVGALYGSAAFFKPAVPVKTAGSAS